jgi:O-antigen ligase
MPAKTYVNILKYGLFASLLTFFFVFPPLLFPYITSKQLSFNILIEALSVFWILLIAKFPEYRPKKSFILYGIIGYFVAIFLSSALGVDPNLSLWGNAERMLGFFHLIHFLFFYIMLITVMRSKQDWKLLLNISVAVSVLITIIGLFKHYPASTIGNAAYVAGLMIFNFFFVGYLFSQTKNFSSRIWYGVAAFFVLLGFWRADISGAQLGLVAGLVVFGVLFAVLNKKRKAKIAGWSLVGLFVLGIICLFAFRTNPVISNTKIGGMLHGFSSANPTLNTRLLSWTSAYLDFKNHPILGTGYGNYAITFDKFFNPKFFDYDRSATYFDRAHNNLIDITSTTGLIGLLAYLSIFVATFYYLIKTFKKDKISLFVFSWLSGLLVAYFVQNLAVFDSLATYISLFITLSLISYLTNLEPGVINRPPKVATKFTIGKEQFLFAVLILLAVIVISRFNIRGFKMFSSVITGYSTVAQGDIVKGVEIYKQAFIKGVPYNRDSRSSLNTLLASNSQALQYLSEADRQMILNYGLELAQANANYNTYDSLMAMQLAQVANTTARFNYQDLKKFNEYSALAMQSIDYAIESSPGRIPLYLIKTDIQFTRGENEDGLQTMKEAIALKPDFADTHCQLANIYFYLTDSNKTYLDSAYEEAGQCIRLNGITLLQSLDLIQGTVEYETKKGNNDILEKIKEYLKTQETQSSQP